MSVKESCDRVLDAQTIDKAAEIADFQLRAGVVARVGLMERLAVEIEDAVLEYVERYQDEITTNMILEMNLSSEDEHVLARILGVRL